MMTKMYETDAVLLNTIENNLLTCFSGEKYTPFFRKNSKVNQ